VKKKLKDKTFCEPIDRAALKRAADDLGVPFDKHIENVISFLRPAEKKLGLGK
jgi:predicted hydrolase (HD superfamily)